jgi:hypothetical protein
MGVSSRMQVPVDGHWRGHGVGRWRLRSDVESGAGSRVLLVLVLGLVLLLLRVLMVELLVGTMRARTRGSKGGRDARVRASVSGVVRRVGRSGGGVNACLGGRAPRAKLA